MFLFVALPCLRNGGEVFFRCCFVLCFSNDTITSVNRQFTYLDGLVYHSYMKVADMNVLLFVQYLISDAENST